MFPARKRLSAVVLAALLSCALVPAYAHGRTFADVEADAWYAWPVDWASDAGYITGYDDGTAFGPDDPLLRGQAATILWRFAGEPSASAASAATATAASAKSDVVPGAYYARGVGWALANNVMSGYGGSNRFGPEDPLTREQLAIIIGHLAGVSEAEAAAASPAEFSALADHETTSSWARSYVIWATHAHIINGVSGTQLAPQATVTRAQMAAILLNSVNGGILEVDPSSKNARSYSVVYAANDGTATTNKMAYQVDEDSTITFNSYRHSGYVFKGWNTTAGGSGTSFREGQHITNLVPAGGSIMLYAQWGEGVRLNDANVLLYDDGELVVQKGVDAQREGTVIARGVGYQLTGGSDFALQCRLRATKITSDCDVVVNTTTLSTFSGWRRLRDVSGLAKWDVHNVTNMNGLFSGCSSLEDITPLAGWDVSGVTQMSGLLRGCTSLSDLSALSGWDVSHVIDMGDLLSGDSSVESLEPLASWETGSVGGLSGAFRGCSGVTDVTPLSGWDVSSALDLDGLFYGCTGVADFSPLDGWQIGESADLTDAFSGVSEGATLPVWYATTVEPAELAS